MMNLIKFKIAISIIQITKEELLKQKSNILQLDKSFDKKDQAGYDEFWKQSKRKLEYINLELDFIAKVETELVVEINRLVKRIFYINLIILLILILLVCLSIYYL